MGKAYTDTSALTVLVQKKRENYLCSFPYNLKAVQVMRDLPGRTWLPGEKAWAIPVDRIPVDELRKRLETVATVKFMFPVSSVPVRCEIEKCVEHLKRRRYSRHTVKNYVFHIRQFLEFLQEPGDFSHDDITGYINRIAQAGVYSSSYQNLAINAVKFYIETVCNRKMPPVALRPKREKHLPMVLSESEVTSIIRSLINIKHKTIICLIYSAGLRVSEAVSLKIADIDFDRALIRIVQGKGKKDRNVPLSGRLHSLMQEYRAEYQPKTWLFEGQKGGMYTVRSIQCLFHEACKRAGITKKATVHTLSRMLTNSKLVSILLYNSSKSMRFSAELCY